jgi:hypothetical protein
LEESDILTGGALRFDGYRHVGVTGFDPRAATERACERRVLDFLDECEAFSALFHLQRWLFKWGGETQGHDVPEWWVMRELFLRTARLPTPLGYVVADYEDEWHRVYVPRLEEAIRVVQDAHVSTRSTWFGDSPESCGKEARRPSGPRNDAGPSRG